MRPVVLPARAVIFQKPLIDLRDHAGLLAPRNAMSFWLVNW